MNCRIIPRLDIKGPNLVKGIQFEGLRIMGKPESFSKFYYEEGADELLYMDIVASLYGRNSLLDIISKTAKEIFIPLSVGGGIRNLDDIRKVLNAGADKVALNTAAIKNPSFINEAAQKFGSSTIIVSIEAKKKRNFYEAYTDNGREKTGKEVIDWSNEVVERGAGEIMITSVDREGTGEGIDEDLVKKITDNLSVPVIASGGVGKKEHVFDLLKKTNANAVSIASMFHYYLLSREDRTVNFNNHLEIKKPNNSIKSCSIKSIKHFLTGQGFVLR